MKQIIIFLMYFSLVGCATERSATNFFKKNDDKLAVLCNERFPAPEIERELIPGDTIVIERTNVIPGVVVPCPEPTADNPKPSVKCPDSEVKMIEKTIRDTIRITVKDTRELYIYQNELKNERELTKALKSERDKYKDDLHEIEKLRNNLIWFIVFFILGGVGLLAIKIFR